MNPRDYQVAALAGICREFTCKRSTLLVLPTGTGKTVVFSLLASQWESGRCLILCPREELVEQAFEKVSAMLPAGEVGIEMAERVAGERPKVVVASQQTMWRDSRRGVFSPHEFGLVVFDEAHHATSAANRRLLKYFDQAKLLGATATPIRADGADLGRVFESVAYEYSLLSAIDDAYLVPISPRRFEVNGLDFSHLRKRRSDFSEHELEEILTQEQPLHEVAFTTLKVLGDMPGLVFASSIKHSQALAAVLNRYKSGSAIALWGDRSPKGRAKRREGVSAFREGRVQLLVSCMLFTEGFDAPNCQAIVCARPTKSVPLKMQMLGRGTRIFPGSLINGVVCPYDRARMIASSPKPQMLALDFSGSFGDHEIVEATDILGSGYSPEVRELAKKKIKDKESVDVGDALEEASVEEAFLRAIRTEASILAEIKARSVSYSEQEINLFSNAKRQNMTPASEKQVAMLMKLGISERAARGFHMKQASATIAKLLRGGK